MSSTTALVSASRSGCHLWQYEEGKLNLVKNIYKHRGATTCAKFNHSNKIVATCGLDGQILLTVVESGAKMRQWSHEHEKGEDFHIPRSSSPVTFLSFSSGSRMLISTGTDGAINLWDLREANLLKCQFHGNEGRAITCAVFDSAKAEYIASGSESGDILIHSILNGNTVSNLQRFKTGGIGNSAPVRALQYSPFNANLLGASYDDGAVLVWDVFGKNIKAEFIKAHFSPTSAIAFSQVNKSLMATAGLDKRIVFFDITSSVVVKSVEVPNPATAMALANDGVTMAVGTTHGEIMIFDLRYGTIPKASLVLKSPDAIKYLEFENPLTKNKKHDAKSPAVSNKVSSTGNNHEYLRESRKASLVVSKKSPSIKNTNLIKENNSPDILAPSSPFPENDSVPKSRKVQLYAPGSPEQATTSANSSSFTPKQGSARKKNDASPFQVPKTTLSKNLPLNGTGGSSKVETEPGTEPDNNAVEKVEATVQRLFSQNMEVLQDQVHNDIKNLHFDMIREFQKLNMEMESRMEAIQDTMDRLLQENEALRNSAAGETFY